VGQYTFYGNLVGGTAGDFREPLGSRWGVTYANQRTDVIAWRDNGGHTAPFSCGTTPSWFPLGDVSLGDFSPFSLGSSAVFDTQETAQLPESPGPIPLPTPVVAPFPAVSNRTTVGGPNFPATFKAGWMGLDLNTFVQGSQFPPYNQSYVLSVDDLDAKDVVSTAVEGSLIEGNARPPQPTPTPTPVR
jgi:hypothetical protein